MKKNNHFTLTFRLLLKTVIYYKMPFKGIWILLMGRPYHNQYPKILYKKGITTNPGEQIQILLAIWTL